MWVICQFCSQKCRLKCSNRKKKLVQLAISCECVATLILGCVYIVLCIVSKEDKNFVLMFYIMTERRFPRGTRDE